MEDFYPTPRHLIDKMVAGINFSIIKTVLEPSAGKGDLCDYLMNMLDMRSRFEIDTIEIVPDLQATLRGKNYRVVYDDFLTFETPKRYDLIFANFPFSDGDKHLQKALDLQEKSGGALIGLVNAETIRNPYTNLRKAIVKKLEDNSATIEYLDGEFSHAERTTNVEVALIKVVMKPIKATVLIDHLQKAQTTGTPDEVATGVVDRDLIKQLVGKFKFETSAGVRLIDEYFSLKPYIMEQVKSEYNKPLIKLEIDNVYNSDSPAAHVNGYLRGLREKYWQLLLNNGTFNKNFTSNLIEDLRRKVTELRDFDFNEHNIAELERELNTKINIGIEQTILKLFDEMSAKHHWYAESDQNVHYYNGWKSNQAHKINKKIILPINGFSSYSWKGDELETYKIKEKMDDMIKVFNWLHKEPAPISIAGQSIENANTTSNFKYLDMYYFTATFYKKGTCHIVFKDQKLLDKFNIFGSQHKNWLPPSYGKKKYKDMDSEEKSIIDEFQGEEEYEKILEDKDYYLVENNQLILSA